MNLQPKQFTDLVFTLERSFHSKYKFEGSPTSLNWVDMHHAKPIPVADLQKPFKEAFYFPMHSVGKEHNTTTKIRAVFDAAAKSSD